MNAHTFTKLLHLQVVSAATDATLDMLDTPPGQEPDARDVALSNWFRHLEEQDKRKVKQVISETAMQTAFNFLTLLDGVTRLDDDDPRSKLELVFVKQSQRSLINGSNVELHQEYVATSKEQVERSETQLDPYTVGSFNVLLSKSRVGDGLDIHHVPDKLASLRQIENYDPDDAPAIALKKGEHRKISENSGRSA